MCKKLISLISVILVLAMVTTSYGQVVIGNWEGDMDGWYIWEADPTCIVDYNDTIGVTLDSNSLKVINPLGWNTSIAIDLNNEGLVDEFFNNNTFSIDITRLANEWTRAASGTHWCSIKFIINADGVGWHDMLDDDSWWSSLDADPNSPRTATWNYSAEKEQINFPNPSYFQLVIATNTGGYTGGGIWYFDNAQFSGSVFARDPDPGDEETEVSIEPILSWAAGSSAATHDVYFDTDEDAVTDANRSSDVLVKQDHGTNSIDIAGEVGTLDFDTTYYWRIDEVNGTTIWPGPVWEFTTGTYLVVDDFESYNPNLEDTWIDNNNADVSLSIDPVHGGAQAMEIDYNNIPAPYYAEVYADTNGPNSLDFGTDWTIQGVEGLGLWLKGNPDAIGSFIEDSGTYTIEGDGWTIWGTADGFHYAYKELAAPNITWQITAKVDSIENTNNWAKAGVMVRKTLEPNSINVALVITPNNGTDFQYRETVGGETTDEITEGLLPPEWLQLTRLSSGTILAAHANTVGTPEESDWTQVGELEDSYATYTAPIYMGLCVTSSNSGELCTAEFSNVSMLRSFPPGTPITGSWANRDIGVPYNDPEKMYVVLEDSDSNGIVYHPDPNATQTGTWTQWMIKLSEFETQDINLTDVQRMYVGVGDRQASSEGGLGEVHIDDIRLYRPYCILSERSADFAKADYAPASYLISGDCVVDEQEIEIMARDWLVDDEVIVTTDPNTDNLVAYYPFYEGQGDIAEDVVGDHNGILSDEGVTWLSPGLMGASAVHVDGGDGSRISIGDWDPVGPNGLTLSAWVKWAGPKEITGDQPQGIICKRDGWADANQLQFMFEVDTPGSNGAIQFRQHADADTDVSTAPGAMLPFIGEWAHVGATFNGTIATIYINGRAVGSGPFFMGGGTGTGMVIGNVNSDEWSNCPGSFNGDIDEVKIYNRAMMTEEVAYLADLTPEDNEHHVPVPSPAELHEGENQGERSVNFRDFAFLATMWLEEETSL